MKTLTSPWRIPGIAGLCFVILSFIAAAINEVPPTYNAAPSSFVKWFAENGQSFRFGHTLAGIAFLLFYFPFFAGFCERLRKAEGNPAIWTRVTWAGAIISPAAGTISGAFMMGAALTAPDVSAEVLKSTITASFYAYVVSGAYAGVVMTGAAIGILKTGVFSRWLGWVALFTGLAAICSIGTFVEKDPAGLFAAINSVAWLIYFLWIGAVSVELIRTRAVASKI